MIIYTLLFNEKQKITVRKQIADTVTILQPDTGSIAGKTDLEYQFSRWGGGISDFELEYFMAHFFIWIDFSVNKDQTWCLIQEEGVVLPDGENGIKELIAEVPAHVDIFFLFDKTNPQEKLEIQPAIMGYFWGSYIYMVSSSGVNKLIRQAQIRQPLDEELLSLIMAGQITAFHTEQLSFMYDEVNSPSFCARRKALYEAVFGHAAWNAENKKAARELLAIISACAHSVDVDLVLHGGTLLGSVRHGGIMAWDDDIDMGVNSDQINKLLHVLDTVPGIHYVKWSNYFSGVQTDYYKIWQEGGVPIEGVPYKFPFVDIWIYYTDTPAMYYKESPPFSKTLFFPLKKIYFEDSIFSAPAEPLGFLDFLFKDWRTTIVIYPYSHQKEQLYFKPLRLAIKVDPLTGQMVEFTKCKGLLS